ncbi:MAG: heparinase II/III family protein [Cytophagales bacterium]|nr:heparinase II/III family protein [Armatimonadota bacterium]
MEERFPKKDPAAAYREFKLADAAGNTLRKPREDWEGARARVRTDKEWAAWLAARRADVDKWIARCRDRVEWVAGWHHDFVSPRDGSFIIWTSEAPGELGTQPLRSTSDPEVALTSKIKAAWVFRFRTNHGEKMAEAARLFRVTQEPQYAEWAASQLDLYADNFEGWPLQKRGSGIWESVARLFHQPLDEAVNLVRHVEAARLIWDTVTPGRRDAWRDKLFLPQTVLLEASFQSIHNIACWQRSAAGQVALLYGDADLWYRAMETPFGIRWQLAEGVTSDYFWYEQSLLYNNYVVQALLPLFLYAGLVHRGEEIKREMQIVHNLLVAPLALRFPNGDLPTPADGQRRKTPNRKLFDDACRVFPTPIGQAGAGRSCTWSSLVDPVLSSTETEPSLPPVRSRRLESSRMALICKDGWQVYFHFGQLLQSHAQSEALHYEAWHGNTDLTHDVGTVGYGSPLHKGYYALGLAHNVPLVNGEGQAGWDHGELLEWSPEQGRVSARQPSYRPGTQARRTLTAFGDRLTDETSLELSRDTPKSLLGLTLHVQGRVELPGGFVPCPDFARNRPLGFDRWNDPVCRPEGADTLTLCVHYPDHVYRLTLRADAPFRAFHASTPDAPPGSRESLYLETADRRRAITFVTIWEPAKP